MNTFSFPNIPSDMKMHDICHKICRSNKLQTDNRIEGFAKAMNDFDYKKHDARRALAPSYEFVCSTLPCYKVRKCEEDFLQYKHFSLFHNQHKHDTVLDRCADLTTNALETFE